VTNFDMSRYEVKSILESSALPIGGAAAKRLREAEAAATLPIGYDDVGRIASQLGDSAALAAYGAHYHAAAAWPTIAFQPAAHAYHPYPQLLRGWCKQEQDHAAIAAAHSLQELHHLNMGAHDFFSQAGQAAAMHGLGSIDNASTEHSTGSNSVVYNAVGGDSNGGGGGYMMPMNAATVTTTTALAASHEQVQGGWPPQGDRHDDAKRAQMAYENYLLNAEAYGSGGRMSSWMPASAQPVAAATSSNDMAGVGRGGAQVFSVWNDT
jgi:AP2-like factor, ANT lineage